MTNYDKHPRNESFSFSYRRGPYRLLTEQQADDWNEKGLALHCTSRETAFPRKLNLAKWNQCPQEKYL